MAGAVSTPEPLTGPTTKMDRETLLLVSPAMFLIGLFLVAPLGLILIFSFLEPGTYGGVEWVFSTGAYVQFLFEEDFLTETLAEASEKRLS